MTTTSPSSAPSNRPHHLFQHPQIRLLLARVTWPKSPFFFISTALGWAPPSPRSNQLWLNLLSDGAPALALGLEKGDPDIMVPAAPTGGAGYQPRDVDRRGCPNRGDRVRRFDLLRVGLEGLWPTARADNGYRVGTFAYDELVLLTAETMASSRSDVGDVPCLHVALRSAIHSSSWGVHQQHMQYAVGSLFLLLLVVTSRCRLCGRSSTPRRSPSTSGSQ